MATNVRGRIGSSSRSYTAGLGMFSGGSTLGGSSRTGSSGARNIGSSTPAGYKGCCSNFHTKIQSFKTLIGQTTGAARFTRPSPTILNSFANWVNKGNIIQICSKAQVSRWAKTCRKNFNTRNATPTTCKNVLAAKFGKTTIKAVARTKTGSFMVVTSPTLKGRTFAFPK